MIGHRDTGATACPGNALYAQLPELRALVGDLGPRGTATRLRAKVTARRATVRFGRQAGVTGRLTVGGGAPLTPLPVEVQAFVGSRWKRVAAVTADANGALHRHDRAQAHPRAARPLRRIAAAAARHLPAVHREGEARGHAEPASPRAAAPGAGTAFRGRVTPVQALRVAGAPERRRGRFRTVGAKRLRVKRDGTFRGRFVPGKLGHLPLLRGREARPRHGARRVARRTASAWRARAAAARSRPS